MAYYLVRARPVNARLDELLAEIESGRIAPLRPFGTALDYSLRHARRDPQGWALWEEEDYCRPPLAMERAAVLDRFFTDLSVELVSQGAGWRRIEQLDALWNPAGDQSKTP